MQNEGFIEIDGVKLEYSWIAGDPDKPIIVLLHEGLGCIAMWKGFPQALNERTGLGVFVYSRQGYGGSDPCFLPRPVSYMHDEARVLSRALDNLPGETFILVGHSDGASIASIYAGSNPDQELAGLVLIAPHFFVEDLSIESIRQVKDYYDNADLRDRLKKYHGEGVDNAFRGWNDVWLAPEFRNWNIVDYLSKINVPTLVIQGDEDEYGSIAQVNTAQELIAANVKVAMMEDCGHSPHRDSEARTLLTIDEFLSTAFLG